MLLPCAKCGHENAEGTAACPKCGAGLVTMMYTPEKRPRGLTRTLIGKAIELRSSIQWANPSQVILVDDPKKAGKKKVRPAARNVIIAVLAVAIAAETVYLVRRKPTEVYEVHIAPPETKPLDEPKAVAKLKEEPEPPPAPAAAPPPLVPAPAPVAAKPAPAPAPKPVNGTLVVTTRRGGKPVNGAVVRLNGVNLGPTPVNANVQPGVYTVKIDMPGFKSEKRTDVAVKASKKVVLTVDLKK